MGRVSDAKERLMEAVLELIWSGSYGSTTIDHICERAGVKKGSFYYFFESKSDLAEAAVDVAAERFREQLDPIYSPTIPPLERIRKHCEFTYAKQAELKSKYGHVLGCPFCTLGTEVSTQDERLCSKVKEIMDRPRRYLETTIRDAHAQGLIDAPDAEQKAAMVYTYVEGLLTRARIQNNLEVLKEMERGVFSILGVSAEKAAV